MFPSECVPTRRTFLATAAALSTAVAGTTFTPEFAFSMESELSDVNVVGPKKGYSPQIGTLVSMMTWMRSVILMPVKGMTQKDLDFLLDEKANHRRLTASSGGYRPPLPCTHFPECSAERPAGAIQREVGHADGTR